MKITLLVVGLIIAGIVGLWFIRKSLTVADVMSAYAKDAVDSARKNFGVELDYSEASIAKLETIVGKQHEAYAKGNRPDEETLETFAKMWGAYLGEVIRKEHGGEWSQPADGPFQGMYVLTTKNGTQLSPAAKVWKRLTEGEEDNLRYYYAVLKQRAL